MQNTSKLMLTIVAGGVVAGAWLGQMSSPVMQFAAQPEWRAKFQERFEPEFSATPFQFVSAGPEDLSPRGWTPGALTAATTPQFAPLPDIDTDHDAALHDATILEASDSAEATAQSLDDKIARIEPPALPVARESAPAAAPESSIVAASLVQ